MDISVIIVTYNTKQMTLECIQSIFQQTFGLEYELILVDNASTDGSRDFFKRYENITYIYSEENIGFGRANNLGLKYAKGDFIFLLNSDTILLNNALLLFLNEMKRMPLNVGCLGTILWDINDIPMHSYGCFPKTIDFLERIINFNIPNLIKRSDLPLADDKYPKQVDYITGADLFMYFEETEMQNRFYKSGFRSVVIDSPKIRHIAGASGRPKKHSLAKNIIELKSIYLYCKKTMNIFMYHFTAILHFLMLPRIILCRAPFYDKYQMIKIIITHI